MDGLEYARWGIAGLYALVLIFAAVTDIRVRRIPNWTVIALIVLYVPWVFVGPHVSWTSALWAFGIALLVTGGLYLGRIVGAGDSKLFTAAALFAGLQLIGPFALATALIGGLIAMGVMIVNPKRVMRGMTAKGREQQRGIPYGVPIAIAALLVMFVPPFGAFHDHATAGLPKAGAPLLAPSPTR